MKIFIYLFLFLSSLLVLTPQSYCQNPVHKGFIVNKQGDTIHGMIDYRDWNLSTKKIVFMASDQSELITYSPIDIKSFSVKNELYQAAIVETEVSPRMMNELNDNAALEIAKDTVFLQVIIKGEKSLFAYTDLFARENFYIEQNGNFELLGFKRYRENQGLAEAHVVENKRFIGQLMLYLSGCESVGNRIQKARYTRNNLELIFLNYYDCVGKNPDETFKHKKLKFEIGVIGGISSSTISFTGGNKEEYLSKTDFSSSTNPTLGIFMDVVLLRKLKRWSVYNEVLYNSYQFTGQYTDIVHSENYTDYDIEIGASYLMMSNMIRYSLGFNRAKILFNMGISSGLLIENTNNQKLVTHFFSTTREKEGPVLESFRSFETGLTAGVGFSYSKLTLDVRGVWGNGISPLAGLKSKTTRILFQLAYRFN